MPAANQKGPTGHEFHEAMIGILVKMDENGENIFSKRSSNVHLVRSNWSMLITNGFCFCS